MLKSNIFLPTICDMAAIKLFIKKQDNEIIRQALIDLNNGKCIFKFEDSESSNL